MCFKKIYSIFFLFLVSLNDAFSQSYKYLTPPPSEIGKNQDVNKMITFIDWIITIVITGLIIFCGATAAKSFKDNKFMEAAGPIIGILVLVIVLAIFLSK